MSWYYYSAALILEHFLGQTEVIPYLPSMFFVLQGSPLSTSPFPSAILSCS
jgi:hypothetical protein